MLPFPLTHQSLRKAHFNNYFITKCLPIQNFSQESVKPTFQWLTSSSGRASICQLKLRLRKPACLPCLKQTYQIFSQRHLCFSQITSLQLMLLNQISKYWVGQKVCLVLSKNKTHFSFSPRTVLNNIFTNRMNFLANPIANSYSWEIQSHF